MVDSLLTALPQIENDTDKLDIYFELTNQYNDINLDTSLLFAKRLLSIANKMNWDMAYLDAYQNIGLVYTLRSKYDSALMYYEKGLKIANEIKDTGSIANCYYSMADVYIDNSQFSISLKYYFDALSLYESIGERNLATLYSDIGNLYSQVDEPEQADKYYQMALQANKEFGDRFDRAYIMMSLVEQLIEEKKYNDALAYSDSIVSIYTEYGNGFFIALGQNFQAICNSEKGNYNKAMTLLNTAGAFFSDASDELYTAYNQVEKARTYIRTADSTGYKYDKELFEPTAQLNYEKAISILTDTRKIFEGTDDQSSLIDIYDLMSQAYEALGKPEDALAFFKMQSALKDSMDIRNESKKVAKLDAKKAMELKDKELELQKLLIAKRRNEKGFLIAGIALMLVIMGVIFRSYRMRGRANKLLSAEKQKSEELLLNILPEEVAEELKEKGSANAMHFDEVTVLFTDFVDFTKASERLTSQELVDELDACFKAFDHITEKYNIEKIKTIGDAYLAVCGLPAVDETHAENVVKASIEILEFMNKRIAELGDKTFEIRIGIHSGDVVAGIVGVKKFAYDIWGDTVNTAARMQQNSEPGKINISETTYELVKDKFTCTYRGEHDAKNKGMLKMYYVEA